jgi:hypothetical protein
MAMAWLASYSGHFTPRDKAPKTYWKGGWVNLRAGLGVMVKKKIPTPAESQTLVV